MDSKQYIDLLEVLAKWQKLWYIDEAGYDMVVNAVPVEDIKSMSVADVATVVHGEWIEYKIPNIICCSVCDWGTGVDEKHFHYCPNCGAKMDGGNHIDLT